MHLLPSCPYVPARYFSPWQFSNCYSLNAYHLEIFTVAASAEFCGALVDNGFRSRGKHQVIHGLMLLEFNQTRINPVISTVKRPWLQILIASLYDFLWQKILLYGKRWREGQLPLLASLISRLHWIFKVFYMSWRRLIYRQCQTACSGNKC